MKSALAGRATMRTRPDAEKQHQRYVKIWAFSGMFGVFVVLLVAFIYLGLIALGIVPGSYWR
jgi:hypothetical protein